MKGSKESLKKLPDLSRIQNCHHLKQDPLVLGMIDSAQEILEELEQPPSIELQIVDLLENLHLLHDRPMTAIQTRRLNQAIIDNEDSFLALGVFDNFHKLWKDQLIITLKTRQTLDPHCQIPYRDTAEVLRYKSYLEHILFVLLCLQHATRPQIESQLLAFCQWVNRTCNAATIAKISVREKPSIDSQIIIELPKHSAVTIFSNQDNHWQKIRLSSHPEITGYVIGAYLKVQEL